MSNEPVTGAPPEPVTPWRAMCNRLVLAAAVQAYDRRHGRTSRRKTARPRVTEPLRQEGGAAA